MPIYLPCPISHLQLSMLYFVRNIGNGDIIIKAFLVCIFCGKNSKFHQLLVTCIFYSILCKILSASKDAFLLFKIDHSAMKNAFNSYITTANNIAFKAVVFFKLDLKIFIRCQNLCHESLKCATCRF